MDAPREPHLLLVRAAIRTKSEANQREHWAAKAKRVKAQRHTTAWLLTTPRATKSKARILDALRDGGLVVHLIRVAPRQLDPGDNLNGSMKAIRDEVAKWLGVDDRAGIGLRFEYGQRKGAPRTYEVEIVMRADEVEAKRCAEWAEVLP
jgi:hypothetical protein